MLLLLLLLHLVTVGHFSPNRGINDKIIELRSSHHKGTSVPGRLLHNSLEYRNKYLRQL